MGIGNTIRGDDGIGIYIAEEIKMEKDRENAHCCGAGGGVRGKFTRLSIDMAKDKLKEAIDKKDDILLTECFSCLHNFKNARKESKILRSIIFLNIFRF